MLTATFYLGLNLRFYLLSNQHKVRIFKVLEYETTLLRNKETSLLSWSPVPITLYGCSKKTRSKRRLISFKNRTRKCLMMHYQRDTKYTLKERHTDHRVTPLTN